MGPNHRSDSSADSAAPVSPLAAVALGASAARMRPATWRNTAHSAGASASASSDAAASACNIAELICCFDQPEDRMPAGAHAYNHMGPASSSFKTVTERRSPPLHKPRAFATDASTTGAHSHITGLMPFPTSTKCEPKAVRMAGHIDVLLGRWARDPWALTEGTHTSQTCAAAGGMNAAGRLAKKASSVAATSCGPARRGMGRPSSRASLISLAAA